MFTKISVGVAALAAVTVGVYLRFIRPWQLRWGATDEEVACSLPGDDVVQHATFNATRGVTIQARPEEIWPWVVQMGINRAGWYSYDWIDNLGRPSAQRIIPAPVNEEVARRVAEFSRDAFRAVGCSGVARVDCLVNQEGVVLVNELNTIPGSFAFYLWEPAGLTFPALLDELLDIAMREASEEQSITRTFETALIESHRGAKAGN